MAGVSQVVPVPSDLRPNTTSGVDIAERSYNAGFSAPLVQDFSAEPPVQDVPLAQQSAYSDAQTAPLKRVQVPPIQGMPIGSINPNPGISNPATDSFARASYIAQNIEVKPGVLRTYVKLPTPKVRGAPEFLDGEHRQTMFAPCGTNVTLGHHGMLQAESGLEKVWSNTYTYDFGKRGESFSAQYTSQNASYAYGAGSTIGEDITPTYVDPLRAQQRSAYISHWLREDAEEALREEAFDQGQTCTLQPYVVDAYTGERMTSICGQLQPIGKRKEQKLHASQWDELVNSITEGFSFDTLRIPWPTEKADHDKRIEMKAYDWFDRTNPDIARDTDFNFVTTASNYIHPGEIKDTWRARGGDNIWDEVMDIVDYALGAD